MVNYICVKMVPDSTKLCLKKGPKSKIPRPRTPLVCHMLCTQIHTCPPPPPPPQQSIQSHFAPLGKKLKETLAGMSVACTLQVILTLKCTNLTLLLYTVYALSYAKPHLLCFVQNKAGPSSKIAGTDSDEGRYSLYNRFCTII